MSMSAPRAETAVLFGGCGFIGSHLATHLLREQIVERVVLFDLVAPRTPLPAGVTWIEGDVRERIPTNGPLERPSLVINLAAIHREPGHEAREYFETNVLGAEHVCDYATNTGCATLLFTSSISVYGPTEAPKSEHSLPVPTTPYGASKLVAERVHQTWQQAEAGRRLLIVRPGVVFGPGEGGNVTRLVKSVRRRLFVYCGNQRVRKAGGYVKELCASLTWMLREMKARELATVTYNFSLDPPPELQAFVATISNILGQPAPRLSVPVLPLLVASHIATSIARLGGVSQPLHPTRVRKLTRSNHIEADVLRAWRYPYRFDLRSALEDWRAEQPADWT